MMQKGGGEKVNIGVHENEATYDVVEPVALIKDLMEEEGTNGNQLSAKLGISRQAVNQMLNRGKGGLRVQSFQKMLDALGYELIVRRAKSDV